MDANPLQITFTGHSEVTPQDGDEAAAALAAVEQFVIDTAPAPTPDSAETGRSNWQQTALEEGIDRWPHPPLAPQPQ
jgi:hypothetical protein